MEPQPTLGFDLFSVPCFVKTYTQQSSACRGGEKANLLLMCSSRQHLNSAEPQWLLWTAKAARIITHNCRITISLIASDLGDIALRYCCGWKDSLTMRRLFASQALGGLPLPSLMSTVYSRDFSFMNKLKREKYQNSEFCLLLRKAC